MEAKKHKEMLRAVIILLIFILFFIFPLFSFLLSIIYMIVIGPKNKVELFILALLICLGGGISGFLYNPEFLDTGDIVRYYEEFFKLKNIGNFNIYSSKYVFYFFYYYVLNHFLEYNDPRIITSIFVFLIYFNFMLAFYYIIKNEYKVNDFKILYVLLFIFAPFLSVISSYRNLLAFSFFYVGIILLSLKRNKIGIIYIISSCFFHPSLILLLFVYIFTKITNYEIKIKVVVLIYMLMYILMYFILKLNQTNNIICFLQAKIKSYILTKELIDMRVVIFSIRYVILYFFNLWILWKIKNKKFNSEYIKNLWNYYILILFFILNKSIFMRYLFISLPMFFPIYLYLYKKSPINIKYRKIIFYIVIILMVHINYFRFWSQEKIGEGFILSIFYTVNDIIDYPFKFKF